MLPLITVSMGVLNEHKAYAYKGDLYKYKKPVFDKYLPFKSEKDFVKNYDYANNRFSCGMFDVGCKINAIEFKANLGLIKLVYSGIKTTAIKPTDITENKEFKKYKTGLAKLSHIILAIFLSWQTMKLVALRYAQADDGMVALNGKLMTVITSGILLGIYDKFIIFILHIQDLAVSAVLSVPSAKDLAVTLFIYGSIYGMEVVLALAIILSVFSISYTYRFVLFGFLYITGVLAIPTAVNDEYNYFSIWLRQMINNGVTLFLQSIAFALGFSALIDWGAFTTGTSFTFAFAFFILALMIPTLLGQLGASSGTGRGIATVVRYATRRGR